MPWWRSATPPASRSRRNWKRRRTWSAAGRRLVTRRRSEERRVGKECRSRCDWSSDVCSSDLDAVVAERDSTRVTLAQELEAKADLERRWSETRHQAEIGRASCRERV